MLACVAGVNWEGEGRGGEGRKNERKMDRITGERKKWPIDAIFERVSASYSFGQIKLNSLLTVAFSFQSCTLRIRT